MIKTSGFSETLKQLLNYLKLKPEYILTFNIINQVSGASCSKLKMVLVNDSLEFQMATLQIHCYLFVKTCENPLLCKGFSHFTT